MNKRMIKNIVMKIFKIIGTMCAAILCVVAALLCCSIKWMFQTWSNLTMDELMYHLNAPLEGTNTDMIHDYMNSCIAPAVLVLIIILILIIQFQRNSKTYLIIMSAISAIACFAAGISVKAAWDKLDVSDYTQNQGTYSKFFDNYYVDPRDVAITFPETKRNLVYIFLESMEVTYTDKEDGGAFDEGCISDLTKLAQENEDFSGNEDNALNGGYSMPGTTWTVAAMFAQGSGIPLNVSIDGNDMDTQETFFPDVVTLGDVLEDEGYNQTLLIGSDATFGGRQLLYKTHGNYNIMDYTYANQEGWIPEDYCVWWGYEDEKLIQFAKEQLKKLSVQDEPFNLTMLTVDTHFEDGYVCNLCPDTFDDNQYANVMACSSKQISELVAWIQQQDFYDNTTIVISGDHPTMDSDFCEDLDEDYVRKVYTTYINAAVERETTEKRDYTTFDDYPTTLAAVGATIEGNRLGLGTNLFSTEQTLTERFDRETMENELLKKSEKLQELASIDKNTEAYKKRTQVIKNPTASIYSGEYDYESASLPIYITNIQDVDLSVQSIELAVWHDEDQNDLTWIQTEVREDGTYVGYVSVDGFAYKTGTYYAEAYVIDGNGNQYLLNSTTGLVE